MEIIVKRGEIERHQMQKEVGKANAVEILSKMAEREEFKSVDKWHRARIDWKDAAKNAKQYKRNLERVMPEKLSPVVKDRMWRRAKQLKDEFIVGMLSHDELHPVKGFSENGKMVWVVDEGKLHQLNSVAREAAWQKMNAEKIREFKNLMRHLCPGDPRAADIERFRPKRKSV